MNETQKALTIYGSACGDEELWIDFRSHLGIV